MRNTRKPLHGPDIENESSRICSGVYKYARGVFVSRLLLAAGCAEVRRGEFSFWGPQTPLRNLRRYDPNSLATPPFRDGQI